MKQTILMLILLLGMVIPVYAQEITAPEAPAQVQELMPEEENSFGEDVWYIIRAALDKLQPEITKGCGVCLCVIAAVIITSLLSGFPGKGKDLTELAGCLTVASLLLGQTGTLIKAAAETVQELSTYGKLLLPTMTAAMAAQGGVTGATALYTGTAIFDVVLSELICKLMIPFTYIYLALTVGKGALGDTLLARLQKLVKWLVTWCLKLVLYVFTGYITITGVVSGTTDQTALKATKLAISGMVPVVGGILSDASEAVLVSAGLMKNAVGIYGLLAMLAIVISPFLRIGVQYLLLKFTGAICGLFGSKQISGVVEDISSAMGLLLAMTGTECLMLMISVVCFMKGVG